MPGLALHTTSPQLGLALQDQTRNTRSQTWNLGHQTSSQLHHLLGTFIQPLKWQDLNWLAVAKGPGGFTGTRLGMVTARTLAQQLNLPLFAISTLGAVAWSQREQHPVIAVEMPAQRGQCFGAIYQVNTYPIIPLIPDQVFTPEGWKKTLEQHSYPLIQTPSDLGETVVPVLELAELGWKQEERPSWTDALPFYGQHPVA
ncbi:tRNA (adenosine(37)-N6)-threonylcarbamoyltransferase complex dimerization subunit type 1 TsaB [Roseofilum sp. BLCC_M154]|uniref:tRNA (Adenosine(37)-N6)-threonylcarbamoyltransferase complex dimerization subunit type 1 TsaB n=1 Tax=Roseofilum acuticapitatum BLCC-M154 TaxID=3022444 RepID=A0ABT7ATZ3_9CYAN|nr:tRNA (adenosine(37)-N6)-threonylcarbamoyltransferase complex dimerization subunit type 1 TsaB [Roseofilum acuticapitatum]MDJ1170382.1 tRNA (adenosine(37)-N6)-threonylcarbamoyltransferase complex dimerization subunit type 1 TsaB [Roseofilum acuticapitatum BLCC-M154]